MTLPPFAARLTALLASTAAVPSQGREATTQTCFYSEAGGESGSLTSRPPDSSYLAWRVLSGGGEVSAGTTLPFDVPGKPLHLGTRTFLVPGRDSRSGHGWVVRVETQLAPRPSVAVVEAIDYGHGIDPYRLSYSAGEGQLYMVDHAGKRLLASPYALAWRLPVIKSYVQVGDAASMSQLGVTWHTVSLREAEGAGVEVSSVHRPYGRYRVYKAGGVWQVTWQASSLPRYSLDILDRERLSDSAPIRVGGFRGMVFLREVATDSMVSRVEAASPDLYYSLPVGAGTMLPRLRYEIGMTDNPQVVPFHFVPLVRRGTPQSGSEVALNAGAIDNGGKCSIGNGAFGVIGIARSVREDPVAIHSYLWMGARRADGSDPMIDVAVNGRSVTVLSQVDAILGPYHHVVRGGSGHGYLYASMPIPEDPNLVGGVPLWQWATLTPSGEVIVSDVFGSLITLPSSERMRGLGKRDARRVLRGNYPGVSGAQESATRAWARSLPGGSMTREKAKGSGSPAGSLTGNRSEENVGRGECDHGARVRARQPEFVSMATTTPSPWFGSWASRSPAGDQMVLLPAAARPPVGAP